MERTLIIIKPDATQRALVGEIIHRFERRGLRIIAMKFIQVSEEQAARLYAEHEGKYFYGDLMGHITAGPVIVMVLEGDNVIQATRTTIGATNPSEATAGTIRGDLALGMGRNLVHGSDSLETAAFEIDIFFEEGEFVTWERGTDRWIFRDEEALRRGGMV